jgi:hypothetical protein
MYLQPMLPSDDDDDYNADDLLDNGEDFNNLFGQANTPDISTHDMADMFRESMLVPLPANVSSNYSKLFRIGKGIKNLRINYIK